MCAYLLIPSKLLFLSMAPYRRCAWEGPRGGHRCGVEQTEPQAIAGDSRADCSQVRLAQN